MADAAAEKAGLRKAHAGFDNTINISGYDNSNYKYSFQFYIMIKIIL